MTRVAGANPRIWVDIFLDNADELRDALADHRRKIEQLEDALTAAGVDHVIETYPARLGFVLRDTPASDAAAQERHWRTLTQLLAQSFGSAP